MMRRSLARILGMMVMLMATPAWAGGIIVVLHSTNDVSHGDALGSETQDAELMLAYRTDSGEIIPLGPWKGDPKVLELSGPPQIDPLLGTQYYPVNEEPSAGEAGVKDAYADDWEYADVGCGGAQAASGPVGALPLLAAGLALLFRRRR